MNVPKENEYFHEWENYKGKLRTSLDCFVVCSTIFALKRMTVMYKHTHHLLVHVYSYPHNLKPNLPYTLASHSFCFPQTLNLSNGFCSQLLPPSSHTHTHTECGSGSGEAYQRRKAAVCVGPCSQSCCPLPSGIGLIQDAIQTPLHAHDGSTPCGANGSAHDTTTYTCTTHWA